SLPMASRDHAAPSLGYLETEVKLARPTRVKNKPQLPSKSPPSKSYGNPCPLEQECLGDNAKWEESQKDFKRARSIWERALEVDCRDHTMWLKYADAEMKNMFVNHAPNVWDRAVTLLPWVYQLWYKYIHMEEVLGNVAGARQIFERWMTWMPDQQRWLSYIKFELRYNEVERARAIFERFVQCLPKVSAWIGFAKFEMKNGEIGRARNCYERAVDKLADDHEEPEQLLVAFAEFEDKCKKTERARCIYKFALDHIPNGRAEEYLYRKFVAFEKQYGDREGIEDAIVGKGGFSMRM
ncbi:hypothetical protein HAX54_034306, partial [Datura stramonium]|nr:hypothetical protein [Datura stramonium]